MNNPMHPNPDRLENYFQELLRPIDSNDAGSALPSLAKYAIVLEGEHVNVALLLENFAGVADPNQKLHQPVLSVDALVHEQPKFYSSSNLLKVNVHDVPITLACKRVETIVDLHESNLSFHYDHSKPWSAGVLKSHWAMLLDVTKLPLQ